jgi:AcrR family transcriptional regulator
VAETQLSRLLARRSRQPDPLTAFKLARRWFTEGRRIEMQELAAELGINRATLFRWVGSRDDLIGEVVWSLAEPTLAAAAEASEERGGARIAAIMGRFADEVNRSEFFQTFLHRESERALRVLATRAGTMQSRLVGAVEALIVEETAQGQLTSQLPPHDLAYLVVRIAESFIYSDSIIGETPDAAKVTQAVRALLS